MSGWTIGKTGEELKERAVDELSDALSDLREFVSRAPNEAGGRVVNDLLGSLDRLELVLIVLRGRPVSIARAGRRK